MSILIMIAIFIVSWIAGLIAGLVIAYLVGARTVANDRARIDYLVNEAIRGIE